MADYDGSITIKAEVDSSEAEKDIKRLNKVIGATEDEIESAGKTASTFSDVLKGSIASEVIISGVTNLADAVGNVAANFVDSAAAVKAESSQFEQTFGALQDAAGDAIGRVADSAGILETRMNTLGSQVYAFARASGGSTSESMALMETALQAAADGAAYYDRSLEDVTATLQSFLKGNYENDAALGLSATEATRNAAAMEMFGKSFMDLSEIQKQQTLLKMVTDAQALSGAMGQAAREADGWENVQGNLNEAWRQFSANAGVPLLENIVPIIQNITAGLSELTDSIDWDAFNNSVSKFVGVIVEHGPAIISTIAGIGAGFLAWNVVSMIQKVIGGVSALKAANDGLRISQIALNAVMNANPIAIVVTLIAGLVAAIITLWNTNEDFRNFWIDTWDKIKNDTKNVINSIIGFFEGMVNKIINGLNWLISQLNKVQISIPEWVPVIGGKAFGFAIPPLGEVSIPRLAQGAVIPPNREFMAVLGDQKSGTNIETPLATMVDAFKMAMRDMNVGGGSQTAIMEVDGQQFAKLVYKYNKSEAHRVGVSLINR